MAVKVASSYAQRARGALIDRHGQVGVLRHCLTTAVEINGVVVPECVQGALDHVVRRHPALRSVFPHGWDIHVIEPEIAVRLTRRLIAGPTVDDRWRQAVADAYLDRMRPFDLTRGPLLRAGLSTVARDRHLLVLSFDQMVIDAQSVVLVIDELVQAAHLLATGKELPLPDTDDYEELRAVEDAWARGPAGMRAAAARLDRLGGLSTGLPWEPAPDTANDDELAHRTVSLPDHVSEQLFARAKQARTVPFSVVLAAFALMTVAGGGDRQVLSSMFASRTTRAAMAVVGWLSNRTAVVTPHWTGTLADCVRAAHVEVMAALDAQSMPFAPPADTFTASLLYLPGVLSGGGQHSMRIGAAHARRLAVSFCPTGAEIDFFVAEGVHRLTGERPRLTLGATAARVRVGQSQLDDLVERWRAAITVIATSPPGMPAADALRMVGG